MKMTGLKSFRQQSFKFEPESPALHGKTVPDENQRETLAASAEPPSPSKLHTLHTVSESENRKKTSKPSRPSSE
jgi:hypothetical protein